jgi:hypothetical protein
MESLSFSLGPSDGNGFYVCDIFRFKSAKKMKVPSERGEKIFFMGCFGNDYLSFCMPIDASKLISLRLSTKRISSINDRTHDSRPTGCRSIVELLRVFKRSTIENEIALRVDYIFNLQKHK